VKEKSNRPVNLDLKSIRFPISAIASILHRISGVITLISVAVLLYLLHYSLESPFQFLETKAIMNNNIFLKLIVLGICIALIYHVFGGIRHLMMDMGYFEEIKSGRLSAQVVIVLTILSSAFVGVWLW
jgi:succinate dehydrogenase / fumarate reductase cytochrome b subunit